MKNSKFWNPNFFLGLFIILNLVIGVAIVSDYGMSWDYWPEQDHSLYNLSYITNQSILDPSDYQAPYDLNFYGPAYITAVQFINVNILSVFPEVETLRVFYYFHFLSFQGAVLFFYLLGKRLLNDWTALTAALLFATQPLFFGHAFINYKDIPFMAFFMASVSLGFMMVDQIVNRQEEIRANLMRRSIRYLFSPLVILAGITAGLTTSIRILGPAAAGVVILNLGLRLKEKSILPAAAYSGWAILTTYITWPYLWSTKFSGFVESWKVMVNFYWDSGVLYEGVIYHAQSLPRSYLPKLMAVQFTEPLLFLLLVGIGIVSYRVSQREKFRVDLVLIALWFIIPFSLVILLKPTMYDNFRQFLFITPPLFIAAGLGLEFLFEKINRGWINALLTAAVLLPGVFAIVNLHPYQYVYYNQLIGGVDGAFRRYELDYWLTSYQEGIDYLNKNADVNAILFVRGNPRIANYYASDAIKIINQGKYGQTLIEGSAYALVETRANVDLTNVTEAEPIYVVQVGDAILLLVKEYPIPRP